MLGVMGFLVNFYCRFTRETVSERILKVMLVTAELIV